MSDNVKNIVGSNPVFNISFGDYTNFEGGKVTITVPYSLESGKDSTNLIIYYIKDGAVVEEIPCKYDNGTVTFSTNHFSDYAVMYVEPSNSELPIIPITIGIIGVIAIIGGFVVLYKKH